MATTDEKVIDSALAPVEAKPMQAVQVLDIRDASAHGLALMKERVENQKQMLKIAIGLTAPNQWTVFSGTDKSGTLRESVYPTGGAADTILRRAFGLTWGEKTISIEETPDGKLATCSAWLMQGGEPVEHFTGYRMLGGYIKTEADLRRAVIENMKSIAVRDLLGLRFRTPAELKELGLDIGRLERRADFQNHQQDPGAVVAPFGREKGKPITDISNESLDWLAKAVKESVEDPAKGKYKARNEQLLAALRGEWRRRNPKEAPAAAENQGEFDYGPPPMDDDE